MLLCLAADEQCQGRFARMYTASVTFLCNNASANRIGVQAISGLVGSSKNFPNLSHSDCDGTDRSRSQRPSQCNGIPVVFESILCVRPASFRRAMSKSPTVLMANGKSFSCLKIDVFIGKTMRIVRCVIVQCAKHRAGANADCPLSLWTVWIIQRLPSLRSHSPVGVVQLWIVRPRSYAYANHR